MPTRSRFAGLKLDEGDRARLKQMETGGARMSVRTWRRVRMLLLLDLGYTVTCPLPKLGPGWTMGEWRASHGGQCPSYSLCWVLFARRSEPAPTSHSRT